VSFGFLFHLAVGVVPRLPQLLEEHHEEGVFQWGALVVLIGLIVYGGLRKGLRGFFGKIVNPH